jgi:hypothetical protein
MMFYGRQMNALEDNRRWVTWNNAKKMFQVYINNIFKVLNMHISRSIARMTILKTECI